MTTTKYFIARVLLAFGIQRRTQYMSDASAEAHLLREAELLLGSNLWGSCENLDELSLEYWNIRKINVQMAQIQKALEHLRQQLEIAHDQREGLLETNSEVDVNMSETRARLLGELDQLTAAHQNVIAEAARKRRAFDGYKIKLQVLLESEDSADTSAIDECKRRSADIKIEFAELKKQRAKITADIKNKDREIRELHEIIVASSQSKKVNFSGMLSQVSDLNRELSTLHAEIGLLKKRRAEYFIEMGRHLSQNRNAQDCAAIIKKQRGLVEVIRALRQSISYNHRIAGV